nr:MAG TPA: hypothetical protein [Caudoviricetes sp.]
MCCRSWWLWSGPYSRHQQSGSESRPATHRGERSGCRCGGRTPGRSNERGQQCTADC